MLTKKGSDLLKYVNDPKNKAKFKKNFEDAEKQELIEEATKKFWRIRFKQEENKRIKKQIIRFAISILILGFVAGLTVL